MSEQLLRIAEVARQLAVSEALVYGMVARGELRSVRLGRALRIDPRDLAAFITVHQTGVPAAATSPGP